MVDSTAATFGEPQVIASLPRPFDQQHGTTWAAPVYGSDGSRKRKRDEVVVGIDGESIAIYGIQNPRLVTSYPIPPQSRLTAAPCSTCHRSSQTSKRRRYTYAALKMDRDSAPHRLLGLVEEVTGSTAGLSSAGPTKHECLLGPKDDPVTFLGTLSGTLDEPQVLSATRSGRIEIRTADLSKVTATMTLQEPDLATQLEHVSLHSAPVARQSILKSRDDLRSALNPTSTKREEPTEDVNLVLVVATYHAPTNAQSLHRKAHLVYCSSKEIAQSNGSELRLLESWPLPASSDSSTIFEASTRFESDLNSGTLYQLEHNHLSSIELGIKARVNKQFQLSQSGPMNIIPISKSMVILMGQATAMLYDVKFGSIQAVRSLMKLGSGNDQRKRKRDSSSSDTPAVKLLSWHAKTSTAVVQVGQELNAIQVSMPKSRKHKTDCRLIDAFARGGASKQEMPTNISQLVTKRLEVMEACKPSKFEKSFFDLLSDLDDADPSKPYHVQRVALQALAILFDWSRPQTTSIRGQTTRMPSVYITYMHVKVFEWLASHNFITPSNISKALHDHRPVRVGSEGRVSPSDLVAAIARQDPSLELLATFATSSQLSLECLVECLRYFLSSFTTRTVTDTPAPTTNGTSATTNGTHQQNSEKDDDDEATETSLADIDLSLAFSLLDPSHAQLRGQALRTILTRLGICHASPSIKAALRSCLTPRDTVLLINLLRIELAHSGWTSRSLDFYPTDEPGVDPADEAIHVIAKLLNCCVDSLGVGGWLGSSLDADANGEIDDPEEDPNIGQLTQDTSAETLIGLRKTTTASLEAAQESAFFSNFLTDFLRYSANVTAARAKDKAGVMTTSGQAGPEANMLPLGVKSAEPISSIRVDAGGEIRERSKRDIARKESQRIGRYTFERIRI